jgi:tRNA-Thr(GGU) m(6)t(6)A37 methyltransferase TsaA
MACARNRIRQYEPMFAIEPIGVVRTDRSEAIDDDWGDVVATIELDPSFDPEAIAGLDDFSHAEVLFVFDRVSDVERGSRHPRGNDAWPRVGIFAQRAKDRPNRLGSTIVEVVSVEGRTITVRGLDAIDGTPVVDIKPVMSEFLPRSEVRQPPWATELMREYWYIGRSPKTAGPTG